MRQAYTAVVFLCIFASSQTVKVSSRPKNVCNSLRYVTCRGFQDTVKDIDRKLEYIDEKLNKVDSSVGDVEIEEDSRYPRHCGEVTEANAKSLHAYGGGVFDIYPVSNDNAVEVSCDLTTEGGKWTVIQRRMDGSVDFYRYWNDYVKGFGSSKGELWLGLETIHQLTKNDDFEMRVELGDWDEQQVYAKYRRFSVADSSDKYRLSVGKYSGNAGDSFRTHHDDSQFSTRDRDNDGDGSKSCAQTRKGGWWYDACYHSNLNGKYFMNGYYPSSNKDGVVWYRWQMSTKYSLKFVEMKIRKKSN